MTLISSNITGTDFKWETSFERGINRKNFCETVHVFGDNVSG